MIAVHDEFANDEMLVMLDAIAEDDSKPHIAYFQMLLGAPAIEFPKLCICCIAVNMRKANKGQAKQTCLDRYIRQLKEMEGSLRNREIALFEDSNFSSDTNHPENSNADRIIS